MNYCATARFVSRDEGTQLRFDTKLWFNPPTNPDAGICIGAVVGLNPGSSSPLPGKAGYTEVDPTMGRVLTAFADAYEELGRKIPENAYVRMWNLCYVREADSDQFLSAVSNAEERNALTSPSALDPTEGENVPCMWFAWTASTPRELALRSRVWTDKLRCPMAYIGPDRLPHTFGGEADLANVRHPSYKSREELAKTVRHLIEQL